LASNALTQLGEPQSDLQKTLAYWHSLHRPEITLAAQSPYKTLPADMVASMLSCTRSEFLHYMLEGFRIGRSSFAT
jgi:hypothetical protein